MDEFHYYRDNKIGRGCYCDWEYDQLFVIC